MTQTARQNSQSGNRRVALALAALAVVYLLIELVSFVGLRVLDGMGKDVYEPTLLGSVSDEHRKILTRVVNGEARYIGFSRELGWVTLPNGKNELFEANSQGVRGVREYSQSPPDGTLRVAAFGDSYIHGDDVPNAEAWSILMEQADPRVEVMNFGVGGYGPDQAYLRYLEEGRDFSPHVVLIGYQTENINRIINVYRPFYNPSTGNPLAKPSFELAGDDLILRENPIQSLAGYQRLLDEPAAVLPAMADQDFHVRFRYTQGFLDVSPTVRLGKGLLFEYRIRYLNPLFEDGQYRTSSEAYKLLIRVLENFHCDVANSGSVPLIVLFPNRADLVTLRDGGDPMYAPLRDQLVQSGHLVVELTEAFAPALESAGIGALIQAHYTGEGNEHVARFLLSELARLDLDDQTGRAALIARQRQICGTHQPH